MSGFLFIVIVVSPILINKDLPMFIEFKNTSAVIIITSAFVFGVLIDQLKLYQLLIGYVNTKRLFREDIGKSLDMDKESISTVFSFITSYAKENSSHDLEKKRSEWILAVNVAIMCLFTIVLWIVLYFLNYLPSLNWYILIIYLFLAFKLHKTAQVELEKSNKEFLLFCKSNKQKILTYLKDVN